MPSRRRFYMVGSGETMTFRNALLPAIITLMAGVASCAQAETRPTRLPPDVVEFGGRRIGCLELSRAAPDDRTVNAMRSLRCSGIENDEQSLRRKYADNPDVLTTLDSILSGHWVKIVKRLPVKLPADDPPDSDP